ncbi:MAG: Uma2 family endonuclease [Planctomycetota bacterium]
MSVTTAKFTLEQYEHMIACGAFAPLDDAGKRIELLNGEIVEMEPPGPFHVSETQALNRWSHQVIGDRAIYVFVQDPIAIPGLDSAPQPDIAWVLAKSFRERYPNPDEVLLLIEVSDSSLAKDRVEKLATYASAGIADYWILNLVDHQVEVYRQPTDATYVEKAIHKPGDAGPSPLCLPEAVLDVAALF